MTEPAHRHLCMNEDCNLYLEIQVTRFRAGDRVITPNGETGTVQSMECQSCQYPLEEERTT